MEWPQAGVLIKTIPNLLAVTPVGDYLRTSNRPDLTDLTVYMILVRRYLVPHSVQWNRVSSCRECKVPLNRLLNR